MELKDKLYNELNLDKSTLYRRINKDSITLLMYFMINKKTGLSQEVKDGIQQDFKVKIFNQRIVTPSISSKIDNDAIYPLLCLDIDTPGEIMIYIISLLDYYDEYNKPAGLNDILQIIFPDGFYSKDTIEIIIDRLIKPKKLKNSYIY